MNVLSLENTSDKLTMSLALRMLGRCLPVEQSSIPSAPEDSVDARSTRSSRRVLGVRLRRSRLRVPPDLIVTPRVLVGIARGLHTQAIAGIIEQLINELDDRAGDPDCEPEDDSDVDDAPTIHASPARRVQSCPWPQVETIRIPVIDK